MLTNRRSMMLPNTPTQKPRHSRTQSWAAFPGQTTTTPTNTNTSTTEPKSRQPTLLTSTTPNLPGYDITTILGTVHGSTTIARKDQKSFLKSMGLSNEAKSLTHMLYSARDQAMERMVRDAVSRGGNAVVGVGFGESEIMGFAQVSVYGTAVFIEKEGTKAEKFGY